MSPRATASEYSLWAAYTLALAEQGDFPFFFAAVHPEFRSQEERLFVCQAGVFLLSWA